MTHPKDSRWNQLRMQELGACPVTRKIAFKSRRDARAFANKLKGKLPHDTIAQRPYRCPHESCGKWHLTSQPKRNTPKQWPTKKPPQTPLQMSA